MSAITIYGDPQLTPINVPDEFLVLDITEAMELLNIYVEQLYPASFIDEILRQLLDYCNADYGIYMAHVSSIVPRLAQRQSWNEEQQGLLNEVVHDSAMHIYMRLKEMRLFEQDGPSGTGFPYCLEVRNGDSVILKHLSS